MTIALTAAALAASACDAPPKQTETAVSIGQAPPGVQQAARKMAGKGRIESITRRKERGEPTVYAVIFDGEGVDRSATLAPDGRVLAEEQELKPDQLPAAVAQTVRTRYPSAKLLEAVRMKREGKTFYEVAVQADGRHVRKLTLDEGGGVTGEAEVAPSAGDDSDRQAIDAYHRGLR